MDALRVTIACLVLAGCARGPKPPAPVTVCAACQPGKPVFPGGAIELATSWRGECAPRDVAAVELIKGDASPRPAPSGCDEARYTVSLTCSAPCTVDGSDQGEFGPYTGVATLRIRPRTTGWFSYKVKLVNVDTRKVHDYAPPEVEVQVPDAIRLACFTSLDAPQPWTGCEGGVVPADKPWIQVIGELGGKADSLLGVRLNGRDDVPVRAVRLAWGDALVISLTDLFPRATDGDQMRPGRYEVTAEIGSLRQTQAFEVR